ncbi:hypothetical protein Prudu_529S000100 [Prunus dulcis]|uniref:Uncharacterized protein n=1 Tax=Prunus dulcis TaxID=3755 RepID=A0A5H2XR32_PRUDU|nr:hypothetical protein Prudu_529S000100 [Prunus dulcis]
MVRGGDFRREFVVVIEAEVISGEHSRCYKQVYIAWWLAGLGEPTFEQFMYLYSISKQQGNFGWVQANCRKAKERGYFIGHKPTTQKSWRNRWCMAYGDWECPPGKRVVQHIPTHFQFVKWGPISNSKRRGEARRWPDIDEAEMQKRLRESRAKKAEKSAGKRPRDDDEGRVADVLGKRKAIEEAHQHVMGSGPRLPPFDLQAPPKLPFGMEDASSAEEGGQPGYAPTGGALSERLLEGVKSDPEAWQRLQLHPSDRAQKTILTSAYAFGEMYVSMAKADKEIQRLKRRDQQAKSKVAEAEEAIREKNALLAQKAALAKEVAARTKEVEELKRSKAEEVAAARAEAIESYRSSEELKSYIMDRLVDEQLRWEDRLVRFNPSLDINFDTSGEPPAQTPPADASTPTPEAEPATEDAPSTES